jgi:4-hydroxybenzoate polyprenyltransferase
MLVLARASNLPTVWSNCLAGWWLGGGRHFARLSPFLFAGVTFLYLGGMFLNDAFDVEFDRQYRKERPIPSGAWSLTAVWRCGLVWLALGSLCLLQLGTGTGALGLALLVCILVYDATHKLITLSPVLMGLCRFLVYIVAASTGAEGITGWAVWCGIALASYVTGLSFLARRESARGPIQNWPLILLGIPIVLALIMNANANCREAALLLSVVLVLWCIRSLRPMFSSVGRDIGRTVSGLLAGIVFVDLLAVADAPHAISLVFLLLFILAVLFQRFAPAT